ncbi:hypothetical protein F5B20DRAFT_574191 [Whalleya microplaca]|nr:hypothetical protein F5B20DRAFT_574191 [Whalleya microplaca]
MSAEPLDFEPLKDEERGLFCDADLEILSFFESAVASSSPDTVDEAANHFVNQLIIAGAGKQSPAEAEGLTATTWQVLIHIASRIPCRHYGQDILVKIIGILNAAEGPWKELPGIMICLRDIWNESPTYEPDPEGDRTFTLDEWLNLNSFVARLFGTSTKGFGNFAIWELRNGLEEDDEETRSAAIRDNRVRVACEWVLQGGRRLLRESSLNSFTTEPEDAAHGSPFRAGPLFSGSRGYNLERWGFWKRRLVESRGRVSDPVQASIDGAVGMMTAVEREVAKTCWEV